MYDNVPCLAYMTKPSSNCYPIEKIDNGRQANNKKGPGHIQKNSIEYYDISD